jgi:predicted RNA-binding protein with PUA-like domain
VTGVARVLSAPRPDPAPPKGWVAELKFLRLIEPPVTLKEIKTSGLFDDWALVRQGRLSTMSVPPEFIAWIEARYPWLKG